MPDAAVSKRPRPWGPPDPEPPPHKRWWAIRRIDEEGGGTRHNRMFRHPTIESARREASYLAITNPGSGFVVLEAVELHRASQAVTCDFTFVAAGELPAIVKPIKTGDS